MSCTKPGCQDTSQHSHLPGIQDLWNLTLQEDAVDHDALKFANAIDGGPRISDLQTLVGEWGKRKGWVFDATQTPEKLLLMITEIVEAVEAYRDGHYPRDLYYTRDSEGDDKPEGIGIELADAVIRILHYCDNFGIDLGKLIQIKMAYNEKRPFRHGGKVI